jgi:hypothetical protein
VHADGDGFRVDVDDGVPVAAMLDEIAFGDAVAAVAAGDTGGLLLGVDGGPVRDLVAPLGHAGDDLFAVWSGGWAELVDVLMGCGAGHYAAMPIKNALIAPLFGLQFLDPVLDGNRAVPPCGSGGSGVRLGGGLGGFVGRLDGALGRVVRSEQ